MSIRQQITRQTDFSCGQISPTAKRADDKPLVRAAARRMENWRILSTGAAEVRPGRRALFLQAGRTDEVRMSATAVYRLSFGSGAVVIRDASGAVIATFSGLPWTLSTVGQIVWARMGRDVYVTYPGMRPRILRWNGVSTWSIASYMERVLASGQKRTPFYRISPGGYRLQPSALSGNITLSALQPTGSGTYNYFVSGMVGTRIRLNGRQVTITGIVDAHTANATANELLYDTMGGISSAVNLQTLFSIDDAVQGSVSGAKGVVVGVSSSNLNILLTSAVYFTVGETIVGPSGTTTFGGVSTLSPAATNLWEEEVFNDYRGYPQSVFVDQNRLGFCDIPAVPNGIAWSAINSPDDLWPGTTGDAGMFEQLNSPDRIYHVVGGADEFVFTDRGVKYIPISESNPLKPGSVAFREITSEATSPVRPASTAEGVLFVDARKARILAVVGTGQTTRPYIAQDISEFHADLIKTPKAITATVGGGAFAERYLIVLNSDGTLAVGKYNASREWVGWVPWSGPGAAQWVSSLESNILLTTKYLPNNVERQVVELMERDRYLDAQVAINAVPAPLAPGGGQGPLWWLASSEVALMKGLRFDGYRQVDESGFLVPEEGEDLTDIDLVAGFVAPATLVPFVRHAGEGQSVHQSQRRRKISRITTSVQNSTGFLLDNSRVPPWRQGEDQSGQPPLREETYSFRKLGREIDPMITIVKDVPGPLRLLELGIEVTV